MEGSCVSGCVMTVCSCVCVAAADPALPDLVGRHGEEHDGVETGLCFLRAATHLHQAHRIQVSVCVYCVGVCVL